MSLSPYPDFSSAHLVNEDVAVQALLNQIIWSDDHAARVQTLAQTLATTIRSSKTSFTDIEQFLTRYPLSSPQGLALMSLAEALLRIPDKDTADQFISDTLKDLDWSAVGGNDLWGKTLQVGLNLAQKTSTGNFLGGLARGASQSALRTSITQMVKHLGSQFVIGETISDAIKAAQKLTGNGFRLSFDMLGEGARTDDDALRYFEHYKNAITTLSSHTNPTQPPKKNAGISVKLSAIHSRYHWTQRDHALPVMIERLKTLCHHAAASQIAITIDAEESDRLELSLEILTALMRDPDLNSWEGLGLAIQAYDKRCVYLIDELAELARTYKRRLHIRLVKGAYWDSEIKRAQVAGLSDYPVFTRKENTDLSYLVAAQKLLSHPDLFYPMFATHNAHTAAAIIQMAPASADYEFQKLYGMGNTLGDSLRITHNIPVSVYAPVGSYQDLLPYLVRRMLENGANTSFVQHIRNESIAISSLIKDPVHAVRARSSYRHQSIPIPLHLYGSHRLNSKGFDLSHNATRRQLSHDIQNLPIIAPLIENKISIDDAFKTARDYFKDWATTPSSTRAAILERIAASLEDNYPTLIHLLQTEGCKTITDAIAEIREAIDFARYYAAEGRKIFNETGVYLNGPTGEDNILYHRARGVFVAISPWNFPLAIFTGQILAALMAGNCVIAKPAEQTPRIAAYVLDLFYKAGLPPAALQIIYGAGDIGAALIQHSAVDGVVFTGSTQVAKFIEQSLAQTSRAIIPLIAETGGQNAMIADTSALPEHLVDDVILSAFGSAGQRCSALRVLYVPHAIADKVIDLLKGALRAFRIGDPRDWSNDMGSLIDNDAYDKIATHCARLTRSGKLVTASNCDLPAPYIAAHIFELSSINELDEEIFGPALHIIRYHPHDLDHIIDDINATGYGLTFGIHSRLKGFAANIGHRVMSGNIYINRSMIGAVVGVQPFGGRGLSGTGPKAGGPHYLTRFATEQTISSNTTASGGNLKLLTLPDADN